MQELTVMTSRWWMLPLHVLLGSLVVTVGAWLAWDSLDRLWVALLVAMTGGLLSWHGRTIGLVWAWTTLLLGLECLAWPLVTVLQIRQATAEPTDEQMGLILSSVLVGLFSAVFWISFSYGLFKRARIGRSALPTMPSASQPVAHQSGSSKKQ